MPKLPPAWRSSAWAAGRFAILTLGLILSGAGSLSAQQPPASADEPEEPDFAFIAAGPYTQKKNSIQFIFPLDWARRRTSLDGLRLEQTQYGALLRTEWGITDRWELDIIFSAAGERERLGMTTLLSDFAWADGVLGVRYRLLEESSAPLTLALGPQVILPTGSLRRGTGHERVGLAWDLAAAKDWGGPVFLYTSVNYALIPSVKDPTLVSTRDFNLHNIFWAAALGLRPLERPRGTSHHDLHAFLEVGVGRDEALEPSPAGALKVAQTTALFSPGIRYGILTQASKLFEIGVAFPVGLNDNTPRLGIIVQVQFEQFLFGGE